MEVTVDEIVSGEEVPGLFGRFEPLHVALSSARRPMQILGPIVQISALSVLDAGEPLMRGDTIPPRLLGHDHPRHLLQTLQKPPEEALRSVGIAPILNEDVDHNAILVNGAPEIVLHDLNPDEDFIHPPLVSWSWPAAARAVGETRTEFRAPAPHRLIRDDNAALGQQPLDIPKTEAEDVVQPDSMADDLGGEPMTIVRVGLRLHAASLRRPRACGQTWLP